MPSPAARLARASHAVGSLLLAVSGILLASSAAADDGGEVVQVRGDRGAGPGQTGSSVAVLTRKELQALPGGDSQTLTQLVLT